MAKLYDMVMKSEAKPILAQKPIDKPKTQAPLEGHQKAIRKPGGVRKEDRANTLEARKPWEALGLSRRAWYYRQAKDKASNGGKQ